MFIINDLELEIIRVLAEIGCREDSSVPLRCLYLQICARRDTIEEGIADHVAGVNGCVTKGVIETNHRCMPPSVKFTSHGYQIALDVVT